MFRKRSTKGTTVVAGGASFEGTLELEGDAHIEGKFEGNLTSGGDISVGPRGHVVGALTANVLTIAGRVEGIAIARATLRVLKSGSAEGQIFYQALQVEAGGVIAGQVLNGSPPAGFLDAAPDSSDDGMAEQQLPSAADEPVEEDSAAVASAEADGDEPSKISSIAPPPSSVPPPRAPTPLQVAGKR